MQTVKITSLGILMATVTACGGGGGGGDSSSSSTPPSNTPPTITTQQRIDAATSTATKNSACTSITPFYWEIGDAKGALASGTGGDNSTTAPNSATQMEIASASKWIFGAYALERTPYATIKSASDINGNSEIDYLNFTSGYDNSGAACTVATTVGACFNAVSLKGGHNSDYHATDAGKFFYNSSHLQGYATNIVSLGGYYDSDSGGTPVLADEIRRLIGQEIVLRYSNPTLAGGVTTDAADYAIFLRKILGGNLQMSQYLDADKVCAWPNMSDCNALYSPVNQSVEGAINNVSNEKWHYSIAHWVEDDPANGDGSYSSPGAFGFYPWIDNSKTYYGIVARHDNGTHIASQPAYITSVYCGRLIRKAWLQGAAQ